jgi:hypothetical protein
MPAICLLLEESQSKRVLMIDGYCAAKPCSTLTLIFLRAFLCIPAYTISLVAGAQLHTGTNPISRMILQHNSEAVKGKKRLT